MKDRYGTPIWVWLCIVAVVIAGVVVIAWGDDDPKPKAALVTSTTANDKIVAAPPEAVQAAAGPGSERGLNGDGNAKTQRSSDLANPDAPAIAGPPPAASPFQRGCLTRSNTANFSYRNGTKPSLIVLHLTVSANRPGWSDVNGVAIFLNRPATSASANYVNDAEGNCLLTVAETLKAWAQANYNSSVACAIEQINTGSEATYAGPLGGPGMRQLATIVHDCAHRWGIPLQRASTSGCSVQRAGVTDHYHLGSCGGGHVDVHRFGQGCRNAGAIVDTGPCIDAVIAAARALDGPQFPPITAKQRARCHELNVIRRRAARTGHYTPRGRANEIKAGQKAHHLRCRLKGHPHLVRR